MQQTEMTERASALLDFMETCELRGSLNQDEYAAIENNCGYLSALFHLLKEVPELPQAALDHISAKLDNADEYKTDLEEQIADLNGEDEG